LVLIPSVKISFCADTVSKVSDPQTVDVAMRGPWSTGSGHDSNGTTPPQLRVIVADDDVLVREGLEHLLTRSGFDVVGRAGDGSQLIDLVRALTPDLVVVDNRMPPTWTTEGLEAAREICKRFPAVGTLVLSASVEVDHVLELLSRGDRVGYLSKSTITEVGQLADALEQISQGGSVIDPSLVHELVTERHSQDPLTRLASAERDVLALVAEGRSDAGIAEILGGSEEEIGHQVRSVFTKLRLPESVSDRHRVLAVLAYLDAR
jgi:serine/threonine-protein kinase PknK